MVMNLTPVALKATIPPVVHQIESTLAVQVGPTRFENQSTTVVRQTLVRKSVDSYLIALEVLDFKQQATDLFSQVTADINQCSQHLLLRTDVHGRLTQVVNAPDLVTRWRKMRPALGMKYADQLAVNSFFDSFEQQLAVPGTFESSLQNKGIYGALFPGVYGHVLDNQQGHTTHRSLSNFFNDLPLPLRLNTVAGAPPAGPYAQQVQLSTVGHLDENGFDALAFQRMMQSVVDDISFPIDLGVTHAEAYTIDLASGWIAHGTQELTAEVPGVYFHQMKHTIASLPDAP